MAIKRTTLILFIVALIGSACSSQSTAVSPAQSTSSSALPPSTTAPSTTASSTPPAVSTPASETDRHTALSFDSVAEFMSYARTGVTNQAVVKFSIPDFHNGEGVEFMDSNFYQFHDEWYWFQLLTGHTIESGPTQPVNESFESIQEAYAWAESIPQRQLPLDLTFVGQENERLYSPEFYRLALNTEPRVFGAGSIVRLGNRDDDVADNWLIELEFSDEPTPAQVEVFFEQLIPSLPPEIGDNLQWVIRSPQQAETAALMAEQALPFGDRVVTYSELVTPGETSVYNGGIAAGRLLLVEEGEAQLTDAVSTDIVIVEEVPDWLPPASGLITSSPQTPLAHVNLLARNRGIPNASQAGILDDAEIRQAARVRAPVIVRATGPDSLEVVLITNDEYREWRSKQSQDEISVPPVVADDLPLAIGLDELALTIDSEDDVAAWRPTIGGKSAGFLALLGTDGVTTPDRPLAVTVRPYVEHLASIDGTLQQMLRDQNFASSVRARFLFLEGAEDYADQYPDEDDAAFAADLTAKHPPGTPLGDVLAADGFVRFFRDVPLNPTTLGELTTILEDRFGTYAVTQGLRFRSSSSVEDIEGFSGAGLYDSNTGFFDPEAQPDEDDHNKTIGRTIKKTWASYWGFEAFEERQREGVDHRSGAMGVLVHARFDDPLEVNNGVATVTLLPESAGDAAIININVQVGNESVTNPDPVNGELPEVISVHIDEDADTRIERIDASTLSPSSDVLADDDVLELVDQVEAVAQLWRERVNASLNADQQIQTLTLDYEFKTMAPGWPALANGPGEPGRLVIKQARSLDPGLRGVSQALRDLPIPHDVLARARRIVEVTCGADTHFEVLTDPLVAPDVGFGQTPLLIGDVSQVDGSCRTDIIFTTATQFLTELLAERDAQ